MKNQEITKTENAIIVNGVVLTEKAIEFLKSLQNRNNEFLCEAREVNNDVISTLIDASEHFESEQQIEINQQLKYLNTFNKQLKHLMKP